MQIQSPFQITWEKLPTSNFVDYFIGKFDKYGDSIALIDSESGKQWTYKQLPECIDKCSEWLATVGIKVGSNVGLITSTTVQTIIMQLACASVGALVICIDGFLGIDELWQKVDSSDVTYCITELQFLTKVEEVRRKATIRGSRRIRVIRTINEAFGESTVRVENRLRRRWSVQQLNHQCTAFSPTEGPNESPPLFTHREEDNDSDKNEHLSSSSSGSDKNVIMLYFGLAETRTPKPIEVSQKSLIINIQQLSCPVFRPPNQEDRMLLVPCIHHNFGLTMTYYALANGAAVITIPKYTPLRLLSLIAKYKITVMYITPPMAHMLAKDDITNEHDLSSLRSILVGGSPIDPEVLTICQERLNLEDLRQIYGTSILGGVATMSHYGCKNHASVGVPLPGMLMKIIDPETKEICLPHQPGHLLVQGPQVNPSFYKFVKATKEVIDIGGYTKTGDAAFYDEDGYIYILGRMRDMIRGKGVLVPPLAVEKLLKTHPGIEDCAVVVRRNHSTQELPAAFIVKSSQHSSLCSTEIKQFAASRVPESQDLKGGVYFVADIPRSVTGTVLRRKLSQKRMTMKEPTPASPSTSSPVTTKATGRKHYISSSIERKSAHNLQHEAKANEKGAK